MSKFTNDEKVERFSKRKILLWLIVIFGLATVVLSVLSLVLKISPVFAVITFVIEAILSKNRTKLSFKEEESGQKN